MEKKAWRYDLRTVIETMGVYDLHHLERLETAAAQV